jgi:hypothetical protein
LGKLLHFVSLVDILPIFYTKKRYRGRLSNFVDNKNASLFAGIQVVQPFGLSH